MKLLKDSIELRALQMAILLWNKEIQFSLIVVFLSNKPEWVVQGD